MDIADTRVSPVRLVAIVGPTAVGKTAAAIELARRLEADIISADSMAIYRGMNIGTAKPTIGEQRLARFHMIDVVNPDEPFTVADFQEAVVSIIDSLITENKTPLLVGGTGLYIRAALDGLDIPSAPPNPEFRKRMIELAESEGNQAVHEMLRKVDPVTAERLHVNDLKRIIRALEVYEQTGVPMSGQYAKSKKPRYPEAVQFGLTIDRQELYKRIDERVDDQLRCGLVEEVAALLDKGYNTDLPAMQGLGYKEIAPYIKGESSFEEVTDTLKRNTRRFAKRQLTWFRADGRIRWIDSTCLTPDAIADRILNELRQLQ
ncbi:MAG: tRNA (adenosine(37)-N6)-dimethylallyltransferase MiaA [Armatimonadota bacterium]|nr:tRNA (adenosine(37)-N6)-dimethylallyltransferase MiaA [Armatimonadota bacterium]